MQKGLTARVLAHFEALESSDGRVLICPELEAYRDELDHRRQRQSEGGKQSAAALQKRRQAEKQAEGAADSLPSSQAGRFLVKSSTDETSKDDKSKVQLLERPIPEEHKEWVSDFTRGEPDFADGTNVSARRGEKGG